MAGPRNPYRLTASLLAFGGGVLGGVSAVLPWWTFTAKSGGISVALSLLPGSSFTATENQTTVSYTYAAQSLNSVGYLYEGVLAFALATLALGILTGVFGLLGVFGRYGSTDRGRAARNWAVTGACVSVIAVVLLVAVQPYAISRGPDGLCPSGGGLTSPCNSFWGSQSVSAASISWGAAIGWYLELGAVIALTAGLVLWLAARNQPWGSPAPPVTPAPPVGLAPSIPDVGTPPASSPPPATRPVEGPTLPP